jgi:hypothetical protein
MPMSLSATFLVIYSEIFFTNPSFCKAERDTFSGISEQFGPRQAVVVHCQQVEQVAERKKQSHYQAGKQAKQEQGTEIVPALLGLYTDVLHP